MYVLNGLQLHGLPISASDTALGSLPLPGQRDNLHFAQSPGDPTLLNLPITATTGQYKLWIIKSGSLSLTIGQEQKRLVSAGQCVLLEPNCHYTLEIAEQEMSSTLQYEEDTDCSHSEAIDHATPSANGRQKQPVRWFEISFEYMQEIPLYMVNAGQNNIDMPNYKERRWICTQAPFTCIGLLPVRQSSEVLRLASRIQMLRAEAREKKQLSFESTTADSRTTDGNLEAVLFQQIVHELLSIVPEPVTQAQPSSDMYLEQTIEYMEQHYAQSITRDKLASIARLSPWYYSTAFQQRYGMSPTAYLNELRLRRAKEQLVIGKLPLRDIADRCGFRDENYFRRRFKASVGVTPLRFAGQNRERIADMSYAYVPHLLALKVMPYAAMVNEERDIHRRPYHASIAVPLVRRRQMNDVLWEHNMKLLASAAPSIILCDDQKERLPYRQQLEQIAPCLYVPWKQLHWRSQLIQVAEYVHHESAASLWLERYEQDIYAIRHKLEQTVAEHSVMLLRITGDQLAVYGRRNVGAVLYDDLKLQCPYDSSSIDVEHRVELDFVEHCNPDHLLLVIDQEPISLAHWERIRYQERWQELAAVRAGRVYTVSEMPWLEYSPLAHQWIANRISSILQS